MSGDVVFPRAVTREDIESAVRETLARNTALGDQAVTYVAGRVIAALSDLAGTDVKGLAVALTRWRSELCGAADVLPHIESEVARLHSDQRRIRDAIHAEHQPCHQPGEDVCSAVPWVHRPTGSAGPACQTCTTPDLEPSPYPCPTIRALDPEEGTPTP